MCTITTQSRIRSDLVFALSVSIAGLIEARPSLGPLPLLCMVGIVTINLLGFFRGPEFQDERYVYDDTDPVLAVAKFIREHTVPTGPLLVYGDQWNSQIPYYSQRRSFVVRKRFSPHLGPLDNPEQYLETSPSAILVCADARSDTEVTQKVAANFPLWSKVSLDMCDIYLPK